jgi:hypothetical protein
MIIKIEKSPIEHKRFRITMDNNKKYDFGLDIGETYIDHKDKIKRKNYLLRHLGNVTEKKLIENLIPSPSLFSAYILWGKFDNIDDNIKFLNNLWLIKHKENDEILGKGLKELTERLIFNHFDYSTSSKKTLYQYGNNMIISIKIMRKPINKIINKFIDFFHKKIYDKYYHLSLICYLNNSKIIKIEKNEIINIEIINEKDLIGDILNLGDIPPITLYQLLKNTNHFLGDRMFKYDAFKNNCQDFILGILTSNNILRNSEGFIKQNVESIPKDKPFLNNISNYITSTASNFSTLIN